MKQNLIILTVALLALAGGLMAQKWTGTTATTTRADPRLNFSLPDLRGTTRNIAEWRGKVLVINFWATWCPPCLKEIPVFVELQQELAERNLQFIGIALEEKEAVEAFLQANPINYPILIGGDAGISLSQQLGNVIGAVPFTIVVDPEGQIIHRQPGELSRTTLLEVLQPLLPQAPSR